VSIIRVEKNEKYFTASNIPFNDETLTWEARGVMGYLLSKPNHWQVMVKDLINSGPAGLEKIQRILKELEEHGYLKRHKVKNEYGKFHWISVVYEDPTLQRVYQSMKGFTIDGSPIDGSPIDGKPPYIVTTETVTTEPVNTETESLRAPKILLTPEDEANAAWFEQQPVPQPSQVPHDVESTKARIRESVVEGEKRTLLTPAEVLNYCGKIPENLRPLALEFCKLFRVPHKTEDSGWRKTFQMWSDLGIRPVHIRLAFASMDQENLTIKCPASVTTYADKARRATLPTQPSMPGFAPRNFTAERLAQESKNGR